MPTWATDPASACPYSLMKVSLGRRSRGVHQVRRTRIRSLMIRGQVELGRPFPCMSLIRYSIGTGSIRPVYM